jgi:hypothetical protein
LALAIVKNRHFFTGRNCKNPFESKGITIQNGPRRLKRIKALHWQTTVRGSFDLQRLSGAVANLIRQLLRVASADRRIVGTTSEP